jgi:hypothetical protein
VRSNYRAVCTGTQKKTAVECRCSRAKNIQLRLAIEGRKMWHKIEKMLVPIFDSFFWLDRQQWIMVFFGALVLGFLCMRGFGSRTKY